MKKKNIPYDSDNIEVRMTGGFVPEYKTEDAAGCDLCACLKKEMVISPGEFCTVPTGLSIEIPEGYEAQVRPRSGLARKYGIGILNSPGTIDADYRGEIMIILFNFGKKPFRIKNGDRIAQLVFNRVVRGHFKKVKRLKRTKRHKGGFGHTGI